jgi:hypothetical protein
MFTPPAGAPDAAVPSVATVASAVSHSFIFFRASGLRKYVVWTTPAVDGISSRETASIGNDRLPLGANTPSVGTTRSFDAFSKILSISLSFTSDLSGAVVSCADASKSAVMA